MADEFLEQHPEQSESPHVSSTVAMNSLPFFRSRICLPFIAPAFPAALSKKATMLLLLTHSRLFFPAYANCPAHVHPL